MERQLRIAEQNPRIFATRVLLEYLEHAIHLVLWGKQVLPQDCFEEVRVLEQWVWKCSAPSLVFYIQEVLNNAKGILLTAVHSINVLIFFRSEDQDRRETVSFEINENMHHGLNVQDYLEQCAVTFGASLYELRRNLPGSKLKEGIITAWTLGVTLKQPIRVFPFRYGKKVSEEASIMAEVCGTQPDDIRRFLAAYIGQVGQQPSNGQLLSILKWPFTALNKSREFTCLKCVFYQFDMRAQDEVEILSSQT